tara:strand:- start:49 stop:912 length:864 start_codon:yes stop_codon:yes gene_type:complete
MIRLALLTLLASLLLGANFGTIGGGPGNIAIYGDSMSNDGNPSACEWCDDLIASGFTVWGMARGGARTYDNDVSDPNQCAAGGTPAYEGCEFFGERQVAHLDGACRRAYGAPIYTGDVTELSCIADLPNSAQTVDVFSFGANDVGSNSLATWNSTLRVLSLAAWEVMLDASDAAGHSNVVVLGPPYLNSVQGFGDSDGALVDLHDALRIECDSRPACAIADVYSAFRAVETDHGTAAMYEMYSDVCPGTSCIHPLDGPTATAGVMPNQIMGNVIKQAIYSANQKRIN